MSGRASRSDVPPVGGAFHVLFVCTANVCRSPAAALLAATAPGVPDWLVVESAGTRALNGEGVHPATAAALNARGLDGGGHIARDVTRPMVEAADLVLTMTRAQRGDVVRLCPTAVRRAFTLLEFAGLCAQAPVGQAELAGIADPASWVADVGRLRGTEARTREDDDVPDPVRGPQSQHDDVVTRIEEALALPLARLSAGVRPR
jgi:protein-tyrosine phosphatase